MTNRKKKNLFEKIAAIDAKQQAAVEKHNKNPSKKDLAEDTWSVRTSRVLLIVSLSLPLAAWIIGAIINPSGWISKDPFIFLYLPLYYWFFTLPFGVALIALVVSKRTNAALILMFLTSFVFSFFIFSTTSSASESEFTG